MRETFAAVEGNGFDPEAVQELQKAYTAVCNALHIFSGDQFGKEAVATRVIDLAITTGVLDATALRDRVLLEAQLATSLEPTPPYGSSSVAAASFVNL
jgi:hypothetical protein